MLKQILGEIANDPASVLVENDVRQHELSQISKSRLPFQTVVHHHVLLTADRRHALMHMDLLNEVDESRAPESSTVNDLTAQVDPSRNASYART